VVALFEAIGNDGDMATDPEPERPPLTIPSDPAELEAWKERYTDDLMAGEQGGIGLTWHDERRRG
jgi:hypothetical protein